MTAPRTRRALAATVALSALLSACVQNQQPVASAQEIQTYTANYPPELQRLYAQVPAQGKRNLVLNHMRAGLAAMDLGHFTHAEASFDEALAVIEAIYADNPDAERARSVWYAESVKDFKGEPYERAMAYYYRGLLYMMKGDYQNARASFRGGLLQDSFMEANERMASDFGALAFLEGWAGRCANFDPGTVNASFTEAAARNPGLGAPPSSANTLMIVETGAAPRKLQAGDRREVLRYARANPAGVSTARFVLGGQSVQGVEAEDLYYQAATRSGRWVDAVNEGKVQYKQGTEVAGQVATAAGAGLLAASAATGNRDMAGAGAAVLLVGLIAQVAADSMKTEADARQWDNLPGNIVLATTTYAPPSSNRRNAPAPGAPNAEAVIDRNGATMTRSLRYSQAGGCALAWGRELPATRIPDEAPFSRPGGR
ncbi:hypothetical protein IAI18_05885 [Acetobacteraceae bacterium H6797]|nr:hypothetical protein [Acetobacteraceae bacterium H6797]